MRKRVKQAGVLFGLFFFEIFLFFRLKTNVIDVIAFLGQSGENNYDEIIINLIGSAVFSVLQIVNLLLSDILFIIFNGAKFKFFSCIFHCNSNSIQECINCLMAFVSSTDCSWGPVQHAKETKAANTAEGFLACAYAEESGCSINQFEKEIVKTRTDEILKEINENGYKSNSQGVYTVHCTGMIIFALNKISEIGIYEISDQDEEKIRKCLKHLLETANQYGWQYENKKTDDIQQNRTLSTLWALRALNAWGYSGNKTFCTVLDNITKHNNGLLGFSINGEARSSVTALLYTLVEEIKNEKTKQRVLCVLDKKKASRFLIKSLREETEFESFEVTAPLHQVLSWTHLSACLAYEALASMLDVMSTFQSALFCFNIGKILKKIDINHNYYIVRSMTYKPSDPFFYPTAYLLMALCKIYGTGKVSLPNEEKSN